MPIETEVKILEINSAGIHKKLLKIGAKKVEDCIIHERIFDFKDKPFPRGNLFRVRHHGNRTEVTFKTNPTGGSKFLEHEEYQTTVEDFDTMCKILELAGLIITNDRQKRRISYVLGKIKFEIDKYPTIPAYMEVEGERKDIVSALKKLGYTLKDTTNMSGSQVLKQYGVNVTYQRFKNK
jgi:adenylate cyclase class 2